MGHRYHLSGVLVVSTHPLPLPSWEGPENPVDALRFEIGPPADPVDDALGWEVRESGLALARTPLGYRLRFPGHADFVLDAAVTRLVCTPRPGVASGTLEQLFVDQLFPLLLHARGRFALHASAVRLPSGGVIGFVGRSGLGKSTLAASLSTLPAHTHFSDDCLALEPTDGAPWALRSYAAARLWPPSADALFADRGDLPLASPRTSKRRVDLPGGAERAPLVRLYLLAADGPIRLEPLRRAAALVALTPHVYRLDGGDRARLAEELAWLEALVRRVPVAELSYPRSFDALAAVRARIAEDGGAP